MSRPYQYHPMTLHVLDKFFFNNKHNKEKTSEFVAFCKTFLYNNIQTILINSVLVDTHLNTNGDKEQILQHIPKYEL